MTESNLLGSYRTKAGLSLWALATRSSVGKDTIHAVERYGYSPSLKTKVKIASALGLEVADIWPATKAEEPKQVCGGCK